MSTPSPVELSDSKVSAAGILSFFVNFHDEIVWESFDRGRELKLTFYEEVKNIGVKVVDREFDKLECLKSFDKCIDSNKTSYHRFLQKKVNPRNLPVIEIMKNKEMTRLSAGDAFGEDSLLTNHKRSVNAECTADCKIATLSRRDYVWKIG